MNIGDVVIAGKRIGVMGKVGVYQGKEKDLHIVEHFDKTREITYNLNWEVIKPYKEGMVYVS